MIEKTAEEQIDKKTAEEQIEAWEDNLALAMADQQWRRALQLCSWLRYALGQQESSDPQVEKAHQQAKEGLAEQLVQEKRQERDREEHRRRRGAIIEQIAAGRNGQALDSIEILHQEGASRAEIIQLLKELKMHMGRVLSPRYRQANRRAAALGNRFDELEARARGA